MDTTHDGSAVARDALEARCRDYVPRSLDPTLWAGLREDAITLVLAAGPLHEGRARLDLEAIAAVAVYLSRTRELITLENILADASLAGFDAAMAASGGEGNRRNKRSRLRRLQATSRDLPWRRERREDGRRLDSLVPPEAAEQLGRILPVDGVAGASGASAVQAAMDDARARRRGAAGPGLSPSVWAAGRRHAAAAGVPLTKRVLEKVVTYEVLTEDAPAALLMVRYGLTRRDLDLALVLAGRLPERPSETRAALLRG